MAKTVGKQKIPPKKILKEYWHSRYLFLLFLPVILYFIVFHYIPMYGAQIAFKDFYPRVGIWASKWVGFKHFNKLFNGMYFWPALRNTLIISFGKLIFGFPAPIILSLMLNEVRHSAFKKTVQTVTYLPHFISWVVLASIVMEVLSPSRGVVNYVLQLFGMDPIFFVGSKEWFKRLSSSDPPCGGIPAGRRSYSSRLSPALIHSCMKQPRWTGPAGSSVSFISRCPASLLRLLLCSYSQ